MMTALFPLPEFPHIASKNELVGREDATLRLYQIHRAHRRQLQRNRPPGRIPRPCAAGACIRPPSRTPCPRAGQLTGKDVRFYLLGAGLSKDQARRVWEQLDENKNGKVNYAEFAAWAQDRLADVAVDDINFTTRSNVNVGQIQAIAASKIGA